MASAPRALGSPLPGPIVVAGLGGSGTRVVADILAGAGVFMGTDLNDDSDNIWFTLLFKRPDWFRAHRESDREIFEVFSTFERAMTGRLTRSAAELRVLWQAASHMMRHGYDRQRRNRGVLWSMSRLVKILRSSPPPPEAWRAWGWKEPNSHIYLNHIIRYWPEVRYIHVIRHGLDMAYSGNQNQLHNWGWLWGIQDAEAAANPPGVALRFWIMSNQTALETAREKLGERSLVIRFEDLCRTPTTEIRRLLDFAGVTWTESDVARLARIPRLPSSSGRYREKGLAAFPEADIAAVRDFGFDV